MICELQDIGQSDIAQRVGAGSTDGAGHIGHTVVDDPVDEICGFAVRRGPTGRDASSLIDGDIHDHGAVFHPRKVFAL